MICQNGTSSAVPAIACGNGLLGIMPECPLQWGWPFVNTGFTLCVMLRTARMTLRSWTRKK